MVGHKEQNVSHNVRQINHNYREVMTDTHNQNND